MTLRHFLLISLVLVPTMGLSEDDWPPRNAIQALLGQEESKKDETVTDSKKERKEELTIDQYIQKLGEAELAQRSGTKTDNATQEEWITILEERGNEAAAFRKRLEEALAALEKGKAWPADLPSVSEMSEHANYLARYSINSAILSRTRASDVSKADRRKYVEMLTESLEDPSEWQWVERRFGHLGVDDFTEKAVENVRKRFDVHKSSNMIRLMGRLDIEYAYEQTRSLREAPVEPDPYDPNWTLMRSPAWIPTLLAARRGDKESMRLAIETVENAPVRQRVYSGFSHLEYTRRPEAVEYLRKYLASDEFADPEDRLSSFALRAARSLSRMLEGFPWPGPEYPLREEIPGMAKEWQAWMREQTEWKFQP